MSPARPKTHRITVSDGRVLTVDEYGDGHGPAVFAHHGTPRCRLDVPADPAWITRSGIRLVIFDRPGYGGSTEFAERTVADTADDVRVIADALSIETFATLGVSWGGPHALATAARLGDRVTRVCVCSGLAPGGLPGFDPQAGLPSATIAEMRAARSGPAALRWFVRCHADGEPSLNPWLEHLAPSDLEILARPQIAARERAIDREWRRDSLEGWVQDSLACHARPWGFALSCVTQPVLLMHGDADGLVPHAHAAALARAIADARLMTIAGGGHWLIDHGPSALQWLTEGATDGPDRGPGARA